ncbi:MAG: hypothetical protein KF678_04550 [Phycisphaeraceae bacterium]|nr:hypothetical protein [Phycisphaeraceae bacterium]
MPHSLLPAHVRTLIAGLALSLGAAANAQCQWTLASPGRPTVPGDPPIRQNHMGVFDSFRSKIIVFGGFLGGFGSYGDTWSWNGTSWSLISETGPIARSVHAMAYDAARDRIVLFGGNAGGALGDTWEWDGESWTEVFPATSPPARFNHAMAYDSVRNVVVLTGGFGAVRYDDTWEFNGTTWTQRTGGFTNFTGRNGHAMEFDPSRNKMVIFGGFITGNIRVGDTWEMGPSGWTQVATTGPSGRQYTGGLTYNPDTQLIYLFGGQIGPASGDRMNDLWSWNGTAWSLVHPGTPAPTPVPSTEPNRRDQHMTIYDRARRQLVVFGGFQGTGLGGVAGDTWTFTCPVSSCYPNCDQSTGSPLLTANDFQCFLNKFAAGDTYANCDGSTGNPLLTANDFQCFLNKFAAGCS